jgi:recyclin-1
LATDERLWEKRWTALGVDGTGLDTVLDELDSQNKTLVGVSRSNEPPTITVGEAEDDFGDFTSAPIGFTSGTEDLADFVITSSFTVTSQPSKVLFSVSSSRGVFRSKFARAHALLTPLTNHLNAAPHLVLSSLFPQSLTMLQQSKTLRLLAQYLSPRVQPLRTWPALLSSLRSTIDRFQAHLLTAFDIADRKHDEKGMREAASSSWEVWDGIASPDEDWEMGRVWTEKREIFYEQGKWQPLQNIT